MFEIGFHTCLFHKHHFRNAQFKWGVLLSVLVMRCSLRLSTHALAGFTLGVLKSMSEILHRVFSCSFHFRFSHVPLSLSLAGFTSGVHSQSERCFPVCLSFNAPSSQLFPQVFPHMLPLWSVQSK